MSSEKRWARRVAAWRSSGLSSTEFCAGRAYSAGGLRHWAHLLSKRVAPPATATTATSPPAVHLVRVERADDAARSSTVPTALRADSTLTIELGAARVAVPAGFDAVTLRAVLDALAATSGGGQR